MCTSIFTGRPSGAGVGFALALALALAGPAAAQDAPASQPKTFTCCSDALVEAIVVEYLDLQSALADHREKDWRPSGELYALSAAVKKAVKLGKLSAEHKAVAEQLQKDVDALKDKPAADVRAGFDAVSRNVVHLAMNHQSTSGKQTIAEAFCTDGGAWLQKGDALRNPYDGGTCSWR